MALPPRPAQLSRPHDRLRVVLANNPSPMTYWGTNTYIVGTGEVAVIDPGPDDPTHMKAILEALEYGERISHIFVTHSHLDHSPGARLLSQRTGAPVHAFGDATAGRSPHMQALADGGDLLGGEGVDAAFSPEVVLEDGALVTHGDWQLEALWTPGHFGNHMAFARPDAGEIFCGDLVMGWASSLVSPPDGDLSAFLRSLSRLAERPEKRFYPGHGEVVADPQSRLAELRAHREMRSAQIREALRDQPGTARQLAERIYTDTPAALLPAATRNVLAHLIDMVTQKEAITQGPIAVHSQFYTPQE